ncbi:MAG TPA: zinc ABC transporter substrate-binding protein [Denitromonas sp.]|uniref:metal ABC transporter solute-binding protein, Zn/Mn family n=1 Tax=Denitromonas sp. TaxID=2734609 RepID=UPI002CDACA90|nr:zinc ABC transporter substrate-binding protein [Denitromonas sp.]HQU88008.1 zinc ABC transporter substrate-binding protein [Denitromonas sp.]HQV15672.1 zinc ABC transporter substrate-binding protein [Denitromonas sp.]
MRRLLMMSLLCLLTGNALADQTPVRVLATFSILADLAHEVGGDRVVVTSLVGPDQDAHGFDPRASDIRRMSQTDLVLANGLGFDPWIARMVAAARYKGRMLTVSDGITPLMADAHDVHDEQRSAPHAHATDGAADPHAWLDIGHARHYVRAIAAALADIDPAGAAHYARRSFTYIAQLDALDADLRARFAALPAHRRTVVTPHDAFGYFAHAYDLHFVAPAGLSNEASPSAASLAMLIDQLRQLKVPVVFFESFADERLIERIRQATGARRGGLLYADALAKAGPASTYLGLMRHNADTLIDGLGAP